MDRINGADFIDIGDGKRGFQDQNAVAGVAGTEVTADFLNSIQEEILTVVEKAGLKADPKKWSQLWEALNLINLPGFRGRHNWHAVKAIDLTSPPSNAQTGDAYLVPTNATGDWVNQKGKIAIKDEKTWIYIASQDGHGIGLPDGRVFIKTNGTYVEKIALDAQSGKWNYAEAQGTANALIASLNPSPQSLTEGMAVTLKVPSNNTGAATLNLNDLGIQPIKSFYGAPLTGGELIENTIIELVYSKQNGWMLTSPTKATGFGYGQIFYSTPGQISWVVPEGVTLIEVEIWGGGGAGGVGNVGASSGGGGSGAYARKRFKVTPGTTLSGVVGSGGARGNYGWNGGNGGTTSFASTITATGGVGGKPNPAGDGGSGGYASGGDINANGCNASAGGYGNGSTGGAGASAPFGGSGGGGGQGIGGPGSIPGGGGGGCGGSATNLGGAGAQGAIFIKW